MKMRYMILISLALFGVIQVYANQDDYLIYVNYDGVIPENAVPLDGSKNQEDTYYVARAWYATTTSPVFEEHDWEGWIPVAVRAGQVSVEVAAITETYESDQIQVLTNPFNRKLEWLSANYENVSRLFDTEIYHPVRGGHFCYGREGAKCFNATAYIGIAEFDNQDLLGRVVTYSYQLSTLDILYVATKVGIGIIYEYTMLVWYY